MGHDFDLAKNDSSPSKATVEINAQKDGQDDTSAADYDPSAAALEDQAKREHDRTLTAPDVEQIAEGVREPATADAVAADATKAAQTAAPVTAPANEDEWEEVEMEVDDDDDEVDMFAAFADDDAPKKKKLIKVRRRKAGAAGGGGTGDIAADVLEVVHNPKASRKATTAVDNVDDTDGYYRVTPGEILDDGRYQVTINLGKGMFSGVVKAKVLKAVDQERRQDVVGREVAIKVIRSQESM
jgi:serine/threonine-protein kinase PRP4